MKILVGKGRTSSSDIEIAELDEDIYRRRGYLSSKDNRFFTMETEIVQYIKNIIIEHHGSYEHGWVLVELPE